MSRRILEEIGIEVVDTDIDYLPLLLENFGEAFPSTREFSSFARGTVVDISSVDNPDLAYMAWIEKEEI